MVNVFGSIIKSIVILLLGVLTNITQLNLKLVGFIILG